MKEIQIDFVVTWLDSNDPEWRNDLSYYGSVSSGHKEKARFRDMNIFRYWFRSVEEYAPWVHKVYLVTNGKFPDWINKDNSKLELINHSDYIAEQYLPTFNSRTIELNLHKIKGLSEHFVYFNDDMLLNSPVKPDYFFKNGLPCDLNKETCFNVPIYTSKDKFGTYLSMLADIGVINKHFNRWKTVLQSPKRWFGMHLGLSGLVMSWILSRQRLFVGFTNLHNEQTYLKSVFKELWDKETELLNSSCTRFREDNTVNSYIFRYWQFARNLFYPMKRSRAFFFIIERNVVNLVEKALHNKNITSICLNDSALCTDDNYEYISCHLKEMLERKFPQKSSFEI